MSLLEFYKLSKIQLPDLVVAFNKSEMLNFLTCLHNSAEVENTRELGCLSHGAKSIQINCNPRKKCVKFRLLRRVLRPRTTRAQFTYWSLDSRSARQQKNSVLFRDNVTYRFSLGSCDWDLGIWKMSLSDLRWRSVRSLKAWCYNTFHLTKKLSLQDIL